MIGEEPAQQRADHRRDTEDGTHRALVLTALAERITSAINAVAVTASPPAPSPWTARQEISHSMSWAKPHAAEATTKSPAASCSTSLRPNRSPNLPASTVATVSANR
ncbi:hypothetical protein GCM10027613_31050 [Microlunatus endophyticus]